MRGGGALAPGVVYGDVPVYRGRPARFPPRALPFRRDGMPSEVSPWTAFHGAAPGTWAPREATARAAAREFAGKHGEWRPPLGLAITQPPIM